MKPTVWACLRRGHSLSVSDIVVLHQDGENTSHYVDAVGYREIPEFTKELSVFSETREEKNTDIEDVAEVAENTAESGIQEEADADKFTYYVIEDLSAGVGSNPRVISRIWGISCSDAMSTLDRLTDMGRGSPPPSIHRLSWQQTVLNT